MFRSTALSRVKLLTVDHKDILELKVVAFASIAGNDDVVCCYNGLVDYTRAGSSRHPGFVL